MNLDLKKGMYRTESVFYVYYCFSVIVIQILMRIFFSDRVKPESGKVNMDRLKMHSPDLTQGNIARIRDLFPGCVTEATDGDGKPRLAVDFDQLRQELSDSIVEGAAGTLSPELAGQAQGADHRQRSHQQNPAPCARGKRGF